MEFHEYVAALVGTGTIGAASFRYIFRPVSDRIEKAHKERSEILKIVPLVEGISKEFSTNGGSSLRDSVNRIENKIHRLGQADHIAMEMSDRAYFETDRSGLCSWVNDAYIHLTGLQRDECIGNGWINAVYPADRYPVRKEWESCYDDKRNFQMQYRVNRSSPVCVTGTAHLVIQLDGSVAGSIGCLTRVLGCESCPKEIKDQCHLSTRL